MRDVTEAFNAWASSKLFPSPPGPQAPRLPWLAQMWRCPRAWIPGTLEWRFRRWCARRLFLISE